jgi:membrane-bound lytic murein transglycosylase MltF
VKLKVTVRQNISQLFDDLDNGMPICWPPGWSITERVKNYQAGPTYYSVSQQLVYRVGNRARAPSQPHRRAAGHCSRATWRLTICRL